MVNYIPCGGCSQLCRLRGSFLFFFWFGGISLRKSRGASAQVKPRQAARLTWYAAREGSHDWRYESCLVSAASTKLLNTRWEMKETSEICHCYQAAEPQGYVCALRELCKSQCQLTVSTCARSIQRWRHCVFFFFLRSLRGCHGRTVGFIPKLNRSRWICNCWAIWVDKGVMIQFLLANRAFITISTELVYIHHSISPPFSLKLNSSQNGSCW